MNRRVVVALVCVLIGLALWAVLANRQTPSGKPQSAVASTSGTDESDARAPDGAPVTPAAEPTYVGRKVCGECHQENFQRHAKHGHAHTFRSAADEDVVNKFIGNSFAAQGYGQYTYGTGSNGLYARILDKFGENEFDLQYALGSGHLAITLVSLLPDRQQGTVLIEHRASWFREGDRLALTPGQRDGPPQTAAECFGVKHQGTVMDKCIDCHTTTAKIVDQRIDDLVPNVNCEKCHGPGSEHVRQARASSTPPAFSIGRDEWDAESEIQLCGSCHRLPFMMSPEALREYEDLTTRFQPVGLLMSECFIESEGALSCTTCHNPHTSVSSETRPSQIQKCIGCHQPSSTSHVSCPVSATDGCIDCHMPKIQVDTLGGGFHDHWIRVRDRTESTPIPPAPIAAVDDTTLSTAPSVIELHNQAIEALESGDPGFAFELVRQAKRAAPDDPDITYLMARVLAQRNRFGQAVKTLDDLAARLPATRLPSLGQTAEWLVGQGRWQDAEDRYRVLLEEVDDTTLVDSYLATLLLRQGRRLEAASHLRKLCRGGSVTESGLRSLLQISAPLAGDASAVELDPIGDLGQARAQIGLGNLAAARQILAAATVDQTDAFALRGRVYALQRDYEPLAQWVTDRPAAPSDVSPDEWFARGVWQANQGQHASAVNSFCQAVLKDVTDQQAYRAMSESLVALGRQTDAESVRSRAQLIEKTQTIGNRMAGREPVDPQAIGELAELLEELQRPLEALAWRLVQVYYRQQSGAISDQQARQAMNQVNQDRQQLLQAGAAEMSREFILCGIDPQSR